jgi:co-chaperonin GroES (HSP10)
VVSETLKKEIKGLSNITDVRAVFALVKKRCSELERLLSTTFKEGDSVYFSNKSGTEMHTGTITKVNSKSVLVLDKSGITFLCSPSLVKKTSD